MKTASFVLMALTLFLGEIQTQSFEVLNKNSLVYQGDVVVVKISEQLKDKGLMLSVFGESYRFNGDGIAYVGVRVDSEPKRHVLYLVETKGQEQIQYGFYYSHIEVLKKEFLINPRMPKMPRISEKERERRLIARNKEKSRIDSALGITSYNTNPASGFWSKPLNLKTLSGKPLGLDDLIITSEFGEKRKVWVYDENDKKYKLINDPHRGVDLKTYQYHKKDTNPKKQVLAIGSGVVVLTGRFSAEGNLIIVDHGSGVFSLYMHLSRISIKQGSKIQAGQVMGLAGSTGASRGPHLHLAVKVNGVNVDPTSLIGMLNLVFLNEVRQ